MTTEQANETLLFTNIADAVQLIILSLLSIRELLTRINLISKRFHEIVSKEDILWRLLTIKTVGLSAGKDWNKKYGTSGQIIVTRVHIDGDSFEMPPSFFLSKLKLIPLHLNNLRIDPGFKSLVGGTGVMDDHQQSMTFIQNMITNHLSIRRATKVTFWSTANRNCPSMEKSKKKFSIDQTKLFGDILKICRPTILDTQCAIVPKMIPRECARGIKELIVAGKYQKHYEFRTLCAVLKRLKNLETVRLGEFGAVNENEVLSIPWPRTLTHVIFNVTRGDDPIGNIPEGNGNYGHSTPKVNGYDILKKDVLSKCPNLKVFESTDS